MDFSNLYDSFCPLLSIGQKEAVECHSECMLFNHDTLSCDLSALKFLSAMVKQEDAEESDQ